MTIEIFYKIVDCLRKATKDSEFENCTYVVGGAVRNLIMNLEIKDIDLCIEMVDGGLKFAEYMQANGHTLGSVVTYPTYGTAMFRLKEFPDYEIECVQTRGEQYHDKESRNPQVTYADIFEDCHRRDLTMNALYFRISDGVTLDLTSNGIDDINNKICRVTNEDPDIVFQDDPLRILRVIRFASRYGFDVEDDTYRSMIKNVDRLSIITQERITDEFNKMLMGNDPVRAMVFLRFTGALKYVLPEFGEMIGMVQNEFHVGDVWEHTMKVINNAAKKEPTLDVMLGAVFHDVGKIKTQTFGEDGRVHFYGHERVGAELTKEIMQRMRYPNDLIKDVVFYVENHMRTKQWGDDLSKMKQKSLRKLEYQAGKRIWKLLEVIDADNKAHKPEHCMNNQVSNIIEEILNAPRNMVEYELPVTGDDIMEFKNIKPGPVVKKYKEHLLKCAFNNPFITKEDCFKQIKNLKFD